jgi:hypothetical protein
MGEYEPDQVAIGLWDRFEIQKKVRAASFRPSTSHRRHLMKAGEGLDLIEQTLEECVGIILLWNRKPDAPDRA